MVGRKSIIFSVSYLFLTLSLMIPRPAPAEYHSFYHRYIEKIGDGDLMAVLAEQLVTLDRLLASAEDPSYRYAEGKWSIKQVIGHMTDTERVMAYRLLAIARGDQTSLPGFDENDYVDEAHFDEQSLPALHQAFVLARRASIALIETLSPSVYANTGTANGSPTSVRALAYILAGHAEHHLRLFRERYGLTDG
ncbi:MAG: DinB family protein [Rhodothermales bacterium]